MDEHNQALVANVHPPDWVNPEPAGIYNLVVIGAGTAGLVTAAGAAGMGAKVALVERHLMGGDCLNVGCVPSKGVISSARVAETVRLARDFGVEVPKGTTVNFADAIARMRKLRAGISPVDSVSRFRELGIDVFLGQADFVDSNTVHVDGKKLHFKKAVIATGARASAPPIPGLETVRYLNNESVFSLTKLPKRFGVIGAGPIGCEMAQSFARFDSVVHLVEAVHGILPKEDPDCAAIVKDGLIKSGVNFYCCGKETQISEADDGIRLGFESHEKGYDFVVDELLVAVGRAPNVEGLGLENVGVDYDKKGVKVDDHYQTTNTNIFAAGDICSPYQFTHAADFMARAVIQNSLFAVGPFGKKKKDALTVPWCTYTTPELAHVGLSESDAKKQNVKIDSYMQKFEHVDRAILEGETEGLVKVNCAKGTDTILGATIVAANAGDMISEICLAMTHGLGLGKIASTIHPYPTQAEAIRKTGDLYNRTRLTPGVKGFFTRWLAWQRR
jgi:pyruvate/2-oxoglutarate dehydrogenase complex dihydrolipoamide dehydrogenase (E3) component